ncbi:hypothetical protein ACRE_011830 [Hapsidospora chrysogenum ATCC 11550]|uniref:Uncharacterized protein n=1 Tax=Hapsidospora chrysogenum (strain ATCC 11550 / CBS 779.69 / DSM 880 / IAM 14645 / JCM 23072 / IMI 49137) TaxID=857340 RepID=A0A086TF52_HAPC1|nr:hypothetical protein ACRE_011830 [Hapsidospora chrysogenum ATCC 11550]
MANPSELLAQTSPSTQRRGRHKVQRSLSELAAPKVDAAAGHRVRHSIHNHHRHHIPHRPHRKDRHQLRDDREPQTAHPGAIRHSLDVPRPDVLSQSRRTTGSVMAARDEGAGPASRVNSNQLPSKESKDEKLLKVLDRTDSRVEGLKQSLGDLHSFSTTATKRLDETYYAVLDKTSALQNTVAALRDLAEASREIYGTFEEESQDIEVDISRQLDALGRFDEQQRTIESLQSRIQTGRARIRSLSGRVDVVRERVEGWERADREWQDRTRRRLKVVWSVMFAVAVAVIMACLTVDFSGPEDAPGSPLDDGTTESATRTLHRLPALNTSRVAPVLSADGPGHGTSEPFLWKRPREEGDRLRGFDEL